MKKQDYDISPIWMTIFFAVFIFAGVIIFTDGEILKSNSKKKTETEAIIQEYIDSNSIDIDSCYLSIDTAWMEVNDEEYKYIIKWNKQNN